MAIGVFKERLVELRAANGLSQEKLAAALDVSKGAVQGWEGGQNLPQGATLLRIGELYGWSVDYLLGLTDDPAPRPPAKGVPGRSRTPRQG
ncbi:MAG: helix-turn-helix domain-containing protein [Thermoleophilia bacterium]